MPYYLHIAFLTKTGQGSMREGLLCCKLTWLYDSQKLLIFILAHIWTLALDLTIIKIPLTYIVEMVSTCS